MRYIVNNANNEILPDFPRRAKANINLDAIKFAEEKNIKDIKKLKPKFTRDPECL